MLKGTDSSAGADGHGSLTQVTTGRWPAEGQRHTAPPHTHQHPAQATYPEGEDKTGASNPRLCPPQDAGPRPSREERTGGPRNRPDESAGSQETRQTDDVAGCVSRHE